MAEKISQTLKLEKALEGAKVKAAFWSEKVKLLEEKYHQASGAEIEKILKDSGVDMVGLKNLLVQAQIKKLEKSTNVEEK